MKNIIGLVLAFGIFFAGCADRQTDPAIVFLTDEENPDSTVLEAPAEPVSTEDAGQDDVTKNETTTDEAAKQTDEYREPDVIFVPTPQDVVDKMLELAQVTKDDLLYDLGCGDGRIVVTAAKRYGCKAVGYDIDPVRVKESLENVQKNNIGHLAAIEQKDIFTLDLSKANVITLYLLPSLNVKLIPQLEKLKPGSRIVSHDFRMRGIKPDKVIKLHSDEDQDEHEIYLWTTPLTKREKKTQDSRSAGQIAYEKRISEFQAEGLPLIDYHIHLKGGLTLEEALEKSRAAGITYGIAENCGLGFTVTNDEQLKQSFDRLEGRPVLKAMQAEGREWVNMFSPEMIAKFDYVFSDALTFHDKQGRRTRLWMADEVNIDDEQEFMEMYVGKIVTILEDEPIDIFVNPTFLPAVIAERYDELWTQQRMQRVVQAAVKNGVAIEINARYRIPSVKFIKLAKQAGAKFAFGTNNGDRELGHLEYSLDVAEQCGLTKDDMFVPKPYGEKPIQTKKRR